MNQQLQQRMNKIIREIEKRRQSEKLLVLSLLLAGIVMGYLTYISDPLAATRAASLSQIDSISQQIQAQQASYDEKVARSQEDPDRFANERLELIRAEQAQLDAEISSRSGELVTPDNMTNILVAALRGQQELRLIQIQNTGAVPLSTGISGEMRAEEEGVIGSLLSGIVRNMSGQVYQHGISLDFTGDYFSTLRYLLLLEQLSDSFYWDSVSYSQSQWPTATVRLQLHTLSTEEGFLGV